MGTASIHEGVRRMRFSSLLERQERGEITQEEAAELLGVHVRTFQRWAGRFQEEGEEGLSDRRMGRPSPKRAPAEELQRMLQSVKKRFIPQLVIRHAQAGDSFRMLAGKPAAYLCAKGACRPPVATVKELERLLDEALS